MLRPLVNNIGYITSTGRKIIYNLINNLGRLWEEAVVVSPKVQFLHFLAETEAKH
jgi:hypothetical protein